MGADLYLLHNLDRDEEGYLSAFPVVDHDSDVEPWEYFRDSYNRSAVMWTLGLSWWEDVASKLDADGVLPPEAAMGLVARIEATPVTLDEETVAAFAEETRETVEAYFTDKRARLLAFLKCGLTYERPIYCSL